MKKTVGVFARRFNKQPDRPFGIQTLFFEGLSKEGQNLGIDFNFFSVDTWQGNETTIDTLQFNGCQWTQKRAPIPEIVFDRFFATRQLRPTAKTFRRFLTENNTQFTTPTALCKVTENKSKFGYFLKKHNLPRIKAFPFTRITEERLQALLAESGRVYLKPYHGLGGNGIVVLERLKWYQGRRQVRLHSLKRDPVTLKSQPLLPALKEYRDFSRYVVQPDANAYRFNNSPVCLRVLIQNQGDKDYSVTGIVAKIGAKKARLAVPGPERTALPLEEMAAYYRTFYKEDILADIPKINEMCLLCCDKLHEQFGSFLELGFDVMLTKDKGPVILETNAKPGRLLFKEVADAYPQGSETEARHRVIQRETMRRPAVFIDSLFRQATAPTALIK